MSDVLIIVDSGIRRGTDIVKALALGGPSGVDGVLKYFRRELADTMLHCGVYKIAELNRSHVQHV